MWLRPLGLCSLEKRKQRRDLVMVYIFLTKQSKGAGTNLFSSLTSDRTVIAWHEIVLREVYVGY